MKNRFLGAFRDMWWLMTILLAACVVMGFIGGPGVSIALVLVLAFTFCYFAIFRYDDQGRQRVDRE